MSKSSNIALAALAVVAAGRTAAAAGHCIDPAALPRLGPKFSRYAAAPEHIARPAPAVLADGDDRLFRTRLREGARDGPNFAGHFTIADWGCGTDCLNWAVIDARTGKVTFDARMRSMELGVADWPKYEALAKAFSAEAREKDAEYQFHFRRDSALLVTLGAPNEDGAREGVAYWHWTGKEFDRLRFIPIRDICTPPQR